MKATKIKAKDTFLKSWKTVSIQRFRFYRIYNFFRRDLPRLFKNLWGFRKEMCGFSWWDFRYNLTIFRRSLEITCEGIETKGIEIDESRMKKVNAIKELIQIIKTIESDNYIELAEMELGEIPNRPLEFKPCEDHHDCYEFVDNDTEDEKEHRRKVYTRSDELEEEYWDRMVRIIRGQKREDIKDFDSDYDGTGMRGWWD